MRTSLTRTDMKSPILLSLICVLAMQLTDLKFFGGIKLGDVLPFILISILFGTIARRSFIPRLYIRFLFIFSALLVISLLCFFGLIFIRQRLLLILFLSGQDLFLFLGIFNIFYAFCSQ